jgi:uroporphyrinogen decarboxylase
MTSRERVLCALNHQEPDRIPIDLGGTNATGMALSTYHRLKQELGISSPTRICHLVGMLADVEQSVKERVGADVAMLRPLTAGPGIHFKNWKPWRLFDGTPVEVPGDFTPVAQDNGDLIWFNAGRPYARMPKGGFYFDLIAKNPGAAHVDLDNYQPHVLTEQELEFYATQAEALYDHTDYAIVAELGPPEQLFAQMGTGDLAAWFMTMATEPDYVHALLGKVTSAWMENLRNFASAVGDRVHAIVCYDDLGTQQSTLISVKMFRELIMPYYQRAFDWIHQHTKTKVMFHSDGAIYPMIPSLIEMGIDILNPIQTSAHGMDPVRLKQEFGDRLVFWGGCCDCQQTLPFGSPEDVAREVAGNLRALGPGGGYVCSGVHNIQAGVPVENVLALFDTARLMPYPQVS